MSFPVIAANPGSGPGQAPESRVPGENWDPVFEMVLDFRRDDVWTPVSAGVTTYYDIIIIGVQPSRLFKFKFEKTRSKIENRFATFTALGRRNKFFLPWASVFENPEWGIPGLGVFVRR